MYIFPWRKAVLNEKLSESNILIFIVSADNIYIKAGLIILEGFQTLIDIPIFLLCIPILILTPYRAKYLKKDFSEKKADKWRGCILIMFLKIFYDIPFLFMLIVIAASIF